MQSGGEIKDVPLMNEWEQEKRDYHLRKAFRIIYKFCLRSFMGNFKSLVFQRLHQQQKRPESTALDWKFKELFGKTKKSEHDELLIEYLNMLATTIQASFKGYLVRKRHKLASQRLNRFMSLLGAAVKGWKTRNVLRCLKIKEEARSLGFKRLEAEKEARTNDNPRRLDYLKRSLKAQNMHFHRHFEELYLTGGWVYEPREKVKLVQKWKHKKQADIKREINFAPVEQQVEAVPVQKERQEEVPKKKRVRQIREGARKGRTKEVEPQQKEEVATTNASVANSVAFSENQSGFGEDRPIQAKGAYTYTQQDNLNNVPKPNLKPATETAIQAGQQPQDDDKKAQIKKVEKKKYEKRQKYDPRKAIEEQKKRKKEEEQAKKEVAENKPEPEQPKQKASSKEKSVISVVESKSQRVIKMEKQDNNRSTVNLPKNKPKVQPKIDCWGNRKTVVAKRPSAQYNIRAKTIQVQPEEPQKTAQLVTSERWAAKIQERRVKEKEKLQHSQQREKARIQIQKNCEQIKQNFQRNKGQSQVAKYIRAQALRQRAAQQTRQRRRQPVYRSIFQLSNTYKQQYSSRYQMLQPKLNLLTAARITQQSSRIPVLTTDSDYVDRMMQQNQLHHRFWHTMVKMNNQLTDFLNN